jgi:hypothetical protein
MGKNRNGRAAADEYAARAETVTPTRVPMRETRRPRCPVDGCGEELTDTSDTMPIPTRGGAIVPRSEWSARVRRWRCNACDVYFYFRDETEEL